MLKVPEYSGLSQLTNSMIGEMAGFLRHAISSYQQKIQDEFWPEDEILEEVCQRMQVRQKSIDNTRDRLKALKPNDPKYQKLDPKTKKPKITLEDEKRTLEMKLFYDLVYGDIELEWFGARARDIYGEDIYLNTKRGKGRRKQDG